MSTTPLSQHPQIYGGPQAIGMHVRPNPWRRAGIALAIAAGVALVLLLGLAAIGRAGRAEDFAEAASARPEVSVRQGKRLASRLAGLAPRGTYVVVDTYRNRLKVYRNGELLRDAVCSTGSGAVVRDPRSGRLWIFDTPMGERRVQQKVKDPVWRKPDWAFVEEGYLPPRNASQRVDDFSLGDYGLYLGDGYIIHGTIFQTLLGKAITHGCIRLGDEDLEFIYREVPLGARVYLY